MQVCVIPFSNTRAEVLLPPSKSITMASRRLAQLPCGGGTPLAHGLSTAIRTAINAQVHWEIGGAFRVLARVSGVCSLSVAVLEGKWSAW
jgi:magnesium chelatase subunit D